MHVDSRKIDQILLTPPRPAGPAELRREGAVFRVGCELPPRETLETIFASDCMEPASLFVLEFENPEQFLRAKELVCLLKKNFSGFLLGRFHQPPSFVLLDSAYAAGIDLVDILLGGSDPHQNAEGMKSLTYARTVFPRWSVLSTLPAGEPVLPRAIDALLAREILPLAEIDPTVTTPEDLAQLFRDLAQGWQGAGALLKPLYPLLQLTTPLVISPPRSGLGRVLDRVDSARLRTASDLRRLLRVRQVEESFELAGL